MIIQHLYKAIQTAIDAGVPIMKIYDQRSLHFTVKSDNSPVTEADLLSHRLIAESLQITGIDVLSEEGDPESWGNIREKGLYWLVDPLDGTQEFINGRDEFTVNIALVMKGKPVLGVIYAPAKMSLYAGAVGDGAGRWDNIEPGQKADESTLKPSKQPLPVCTENDTFTIVGSVSRLTDATQSFITRLSMSLKPLKFLQAGSSLKFCLVASGEADLYPRMDTIMEWDSAAGQAIIEAAGGTVKTWPEGQPLMCNNKGHFNPEFIAIAPGRPESLFFK
jgi:3'(2'), 5'-bisphosphate nucleotidase